MANICTNSILVTFINPENDVDYKESFLDEFNNNYEIYNDPSYDIEEDLDSVEIDFGSKWSAPLVDLQDYCNKYALSIIGVATEFANGYVEAFELTIDINE